MSVLYVAIGGALGSVARYLMISFIGRIHPGAFPYGTLAVNILGGFLMGVLIAATAALLPVRGRDIHLLLAVGVLGGFTTFSTFSLDLYTLYIDRLWLQAAVYALGSMVLSVLALMAGMWFVHKL